MQLSKYDYQTGDFLLIFLRAYVDLPCKGSFKKIYLNAISLNFQFQLNNVYLGYILNDTSEKKYKILQKKFWEKKSSFFLQTLNYNVSLQMGFRRISSLLNLVNFYFTVTCFL